MTRVQLAAMWQAAQSAPFMGRCVKPATGRAAKAAPALWQEAQLLLIPVWLKSCFPPSAVWWHE
jgi:hypothetical protein